MNREEERSPVHRLTSLVLSVALLPGVLGLATEYWLLGDVTSRHVGLWKICENTSCEPVSLDTIPDWFSSVRGLCMVAMCLHVISILTGCCCACLGLQEVKAFSFLPRLEEVSAIVAAVLMGGGLALFALSAHRHPVYSSFRLNWSFWLCLAHACILLLCGGVIALTRTDSASPKWRSAAKPMDRNIQKQKNKSLESALLPPKGGEYELWLGNSEEDITHPVVYVDERERRSVIKHTFFERLQQ